MVYLGEPEPLSSGVAAKERVFAGPWIRRQDREVVSEGLGAGAGLDESNFQGFGCHSLGAGKGGGRATPSRDEAKVYYQSARYGRAAGTVRLSRAFGYRVEPIDDADIYQEEVLQLLLHAPGGGGLMEPGAQI